MKTYKIFLSPAPKAVRVVGTNRTDDGSSGTVIIRGKDAAVYPERLGQDPRVLALVRTIIGAKEGPKS